MSFEAAFKQNLLMNKASKFGAYYLARIYKAFEQNGGQKEHIIYPACSNLENSFTPIKIPIINVKCTNPETCVLDLDQFIQYLKKKIKQEASINDSITCPRCNKSVVLKEYVIDSGFEYILRDFEMQSKLKITAEESKSEVGNNQPIKTQAKDRFYIYRDGTYFYLSESDGELNDLLKIKKMIEKATSNRILQAALSNEKTVTEKLLKLKSDYLASFQNKIASSLPTGSNTKVKAEFCVLKVLKDSKERMTISSHYTRLIFWFPTIKNKAKNFLQVDLYKEDFSDLQQFNYFSHIIRIPEVGVWITGGVQNHPRPMVIKDCYEVALKNCSLAGKAKCVKLPDLLEPVFNHAGVCVNDYVYICGGGNGSQLNPITFRISWKNPVKWEKMANMLSKRISHSVLNIKGDIYCFGGGDQTPKFMPNPNVERYIVKDNKWEVLKVKNQECFVPAAHMFAQLLKDDTEVLIWGGADHDLKTSMTGGFTFDLRQNEFKVFHQEFRAPAKSTTDFSDLNTVKDADYLYFLTPYSSDGKKTAFAQFTFSFKDRKFEYNGRKYLDNDGRERKTESKSTKMDDSVVSKK